MDTSITLDYDKQLIRSVVFSYWWHLVGPGYVVAMVFLVGMYVAYERAAYPPTWYTGFWAGLLFIALALPILVLVCYYVSSMRRLGQMKPPQVALILTDDSFSFASSLGSTSLHWPTVKEVRRYRRYWLLFFSRSQFFTLPLANVSEPAQAFVLQRVLAAGGRVG